MRVDVLFSAFFSVAVGRVEQRNPSRQEGPTFVLVPKLVFGNELETVLRSGEYRAAWPTASQ